MMDNQLRQIIIDSAVLDRRLDGKPVTRVGIAEVLDAVAAAYKRETGRDLDPNLQECVGFCAGFKAGAQYVSDRFFGEKS